MRLLELRCKGKASFRFGNLGQRERSAFCCEVNGVW